MSDLATLQSEAAAGLLAGESIAGYGVAAEVHHGTIIGGLINALRLDFPTVDWLVGEAFFDQAARDYAAVRPPRRMLLDDYGEAFPAFLQSYGPAESLPYLADTAWFDLAVARAGACVPGRMGRPIPIGEGLALAIDASLALLTVAYRADLIRDAMMDSQPETLELTPGAFVYAVWRGEAGAHARPLAAGSAAFLETLLVGSSAEAGLERLLEVAGEAGLAALQSEIFSAPFARLSPTDLERPAP